VRFELAYKAIAPGLQIIAPWREWTIRSREDAIAYALAHNIPIQQSTANIYSRDRNIWHLSHEGGRLEDPANGPEESMWQWVVSPERAPDTPAEVEIGFEGGTPISVNGSRLGPVQLLGELNAIAATHGVGRIDLVENRWSGSSPAARMKRPGHATRDGASRTRSAVSGSRNIAFPATLAFATPSWSITACGSPRCAKLWTLSFEYQQRVTGTVGLKLYKGNISVATRSSPYSLYRTELASSP